MSGKNAFFTWLTFWVVLSFIQISLGGFAVTTITGATDSGISTGWGVAAVAGVLLITAIQSFVFTLMITAIIIFSKKKKP